MDGPPQHDSLDVAILGSGLGGSTLASILAGQGFSTLRLESGTQPRFAVGESVVPEFVAWARIIAYLFDVPKLEYLGNFQSLRHHLRSNSGIKRNFTFLTYRDNEEHRREESCQFQTMTYPLGPDSHVYRSDLDAWLSALAISRGAGYHKRTTVDDVSIDEDGVTPGAGERKFRCRFVVDASGFRWVLAEKLGLRTDVKYATNSRTIFTHMVGVRRMDSVMTNGKRPPIPGLVDQRTLHHIFDGGWFWIIPFNNHHHSPAKARMGARPLAIVISWNGIRILEWLRIIWNVRR